MNLAELLAIPASMYPDHEIVRFEGQTATYQELQERVAQAAGALAALGVESGDRVATLQTNTLDVVVCLYAAATIGAVFVPLSYRARSDELTHMLSVAGPRVLLAGDRYLDLAREANALQSAPAALLVLEPDSDGVPCLDEAGADAVAWPADVADDDLAVLLFTSGTTAAAKAVMLSHGGLTSFVLGSVEPADGSDRGSTLLAAPLYHVAGLSSALTATFAGRRMVVLRQFEAGQWLETVEKERVTHAFLVPTMLRRVLDDPRFPTTTLSSLEVLSYGAAPMPPAVILRAIEAFPAPVQFIGAFGQTETASTVAVLTPEDHRLDGDSAEVLRKIRRLTSIGRPLAGVEMRIADEDGGALPHEAVGEIWVRSDRNTRGYYGQQQTEPGASDGWVRTGDLGWTDEDGYVYLAGRKSDLIIRGGENIAPDEVEAALGSHPAVAEAAVIGLPDEEWGERVGAVVVLIPGAGVSADDLVEHCRQHLASFKKPETIYFTDTLPRNALGKLLRRELRARYGERDTEVVESP